MNILISACLVGARCRYNGLGAYSDKVMVLAAKHTLIPVCPEQLGGLSTPRAAAEILGGRVITADGADVTGPFESGAEEALKICQLHNCRCAILKARSPSCGKAQIYDGSFSGTLRDGNGMTAKLLMENSIQVIDEYEVDTLLN